MSLLKLSRCPLLLRRPAHLPILWQIRHVFVVRRRNVSSCATLLARRTHVPRPSRPTRDHHVSDINYFDEEVAPDGSRQRYPSEENQEALERQEEEDDAELEELEREAELLGIPTEMSEEEAQQLFSQDELASIKAANEGRIDETGVDILKHQVSVPEDIPPPNRVFVNRFNVNMDRASLMPKNSNARKSLWRYYERCKIYIPNFTSLLPVAAWDLLWLSQGEESPSNPDRASHLKVLSQDMAKIGLTLSEEQRFARIEGLFLEGKEDTALEQWEAGLKSGDSGSPKFLDMGVRMYARHGNVQRAEELLDVLLKLHKDWDPQVIIPVIQCCTEEGGSPYIERAWALYLRFQDRLSTDVTMDDYDKISLDFLRADRRDLAVAVFRDMMMAGDRSNEKSSEFYRLAVQRLGEFISLSEDAKEVNKLSLESLTVLPREFQNKFFFASWLKKLIGMGEVNAASQVVELMYERRTKPDAKHLNGLMNALLGGGSKANQTRAEAMGWAMIQQRLDFVRERTAKKYPNQKLPGISVYQTGEDIEIPTAESRPCPAATIETFSILVRYYLRRGKFAHVRHLRDNLHLAEIRMNSFFMNHLLYAELRNRTHREVWARFQVMSKTIMPDLETFLCLWDCMKYHVSISESPNARENNELPAFPSPRELFASMMNWFSRLKGQPLQDALGDMEQEYYHDILRCFCLDRDVPGTFVAMHVLKSIFHVYPDEVTVQLLANQVARLNMKRPKSHRHARRLTKNVEKQDGLQKMRQMLNVIQEHRLQQMNSQDTEFSKEHSNEEQHRSLLHLLYTLIERRADRSTKVEDIINQCADEMGVERFDVDATMALVL